MTPNLVLFDCDGVLVDSETVTNRIIQKNLAARGLCLPLEQIVTLFVGGTMAGVRDTAQSMGAILESNWLDLIYGEMFAGLAAQCEVISGVTEVLDHLDCAHIPYAVCSNGPHAKMDITLTACGLKERFGGRIYSREDVPAPKPAPDVYLYAAKLADIAPARCVVIEDSTSGAKAGKAAGMRTLGYVAESNPTRLAPICDVLFDDMRKLPKLLHLPHAAVAQS
ncbi:HAD family hydrolase [Shimia sp.]|jgi:HAD superfamily hydrolase (TIGR01509 family)|uniref:HAD family hydrolase n=1 Tax=unclassified Shimia TaxID=2630038 RepID=UPI0025EC3434|nr:HAD family phosphatase [Shimia sp.]MCH2067200.1 HAD family phosphatase [Shimia sp.]